MKSIINAMNAPTGPNFGLRTPAAGNIPASNRRSWSLILFLLLALGAVPGVSHAEGPLLPDPLPPTGFEPVALPGLPATLLSTDQAEYAPGTTAYIRGIGFLAGETVTLQVLHADGTPSSDDYHSPSISSAEVHSEIDAWQDRPTQTDDSL